MNLARWTSRQRRRQPRVENLEDRCLLSDTVITFDDLPAGTPVEHQYAVPPHDLGVDFTAINTINGNKYLPVIEQVPAGQAQSGTQVASLWPANAGLEFFVPSVSGTFTKSTRQHVKVYVGESEEPTPTISVLTMTAYRSNGTQIVSSPVTVHSGAGFHTPLEVDSPEPDIISFTISARGPAPGYPGDLDRRLAIDDLTFDNPTVVQPDFNLLPATSVIEVGPGQSVSDVITINRLGGSAGDIQFAAGGLPPGVTATFAPNPAGGDGTTLTLTAAPDAPTTYTGSVTVTAMPLVPGAGSVARETKLNVQVRPDFTVGLEGPTEVNLPYGSSITVPVTVTRQSFAFLDPPINLSVSGLPPGVTAVFDPATVGTPLNNGLINHSTLKLTALPGQQIPGIFVLDLEAKNGLETSHASLTVHGIPVQITSFSPSDGWTPVALKPGTEVVLRGTGFSPGSQVQFGNKYAQVKPESIAADGTEMHVLVPRLATTGPLTVITPLGHSASSPTPFTVHSYRNIDGFAFTNFDFSGVSFETVAELFGFNQTHMGINLCWPFYDCTIPLPIPDPSAIAFAAAAGIALTDGQCFGVSLASQRLILGQKSYDAFPLQASAAKSTVWNLEGPGGPTYGLLSYIHMQHVAQLSAENVNDVIAARFNNTYSGIYSQVYNSLSQGVFPLIEIQDGDGHTVVAYDLEYAPSGQDGFYIYVYDPNVPFSVVEDRNADLHRRAEGYSDATGDHGSRIHVFTDGHWEFPNLGWSESVSHLVVSPPTSIPVQPTLPDTVQGLLEIIFGGSAQTTQVADAAGHSLLNPDGTEDTDAATRLPNAAVFYPEHGQDPSRPMFMLEGSGPYTQTVRGTGTGTYDDTLFGYNFDAHVLDSATTQGIDDTLTLDAQAGSFQFKTDAASKPLTLQLIARAPDVSQHTAVINTESFHNGSDRFTFDANREVLTYTHAGAGTDYTLSLSGVDPTSQQLVTFVSPTLHIGPGDTAMFQPSDWHRLNSGTVVMTIIHPDGRKEIQILNDGPTVVDLSRSGVHHQPTHLVLTFSEPLDPSRAQDLSNYILVAPGHDERFGTRDDRVIRMNSATYDPATRTVTLIPSHHLNWYRRYRITVKGTGPAGLTDLAGKLLDGDGDGQPGGDYVAIIRGYGLDRIGRPHPKVPMPFRHTGNGLNGVRAVRGHCCGSPV